MTWSAIVHWLEMTRIAEVLISIYTIIETVRLLTKWSRNRQWFKGTPSRAQRDKSLPAKARISDRSVGLLCAVASAVVWSIGYVALRYVVLRTGLYETNLVLMGSGFLFLLFAWTWTQSRAGRSNETEFPGWRSPEFLIVVVANIASFLLFTYALHFISASQSITLQKLNPLLVALATWIWLKQKPSAASLSSALLAVLGTTLIMTSVGDTIHLDTIDRVEGSLLAIVAGAAFAVFGVGLESVRERTPALPSQVGFMTLVFFLSYLLTASVSGFHQGPLRIDSASLAILVANGLRIAVVYLLYQAAVQRLGALLASVVVALEVPMTMIWEWRVLDVAPGWRLGLGSLAIVAAALNLMTDQKLREGSAPGAAGSSQ
jgi:drug/metabolite transporter (DMT)-like permease